MNAKDNGGPAFPWTDLNNDGTPWAQFSGMSLRDWFAGQPGIEGSLHLIDKEAGEQLCGPRPDDPLEAYKWQCRVQAACRFIAADAMLEARK